MRIIRVLFFISLQLYILGCKNNYQDKIVFWEYNKNLILEDLNTKLFKELVIDNKYKEIPLDYFKYYYWDEQILFMERKIFEENNYYLVFEKIQENSDRGSLFFSVVINNKIVCNGLNRILPNWYAKMEPYDDTDYQRITMAKNDSGVYFFFTFSELSTLHGWSIWTQNIINSIDYNTDSPHINSRGDKMFVHNIINDIQILFNEDLYNYFYKKIK
jgi:hypothetical protein